MAPASGERMIAVPTVEGVHMHRRRALLAGTVLLILALGGGTASGATRYPDRMGDVQPGAGPDVVWLRLSDTKTSVRLVVRFAQAPPLRVGRDEGWIDMLLVGIDVPPLGPPPRAPGGVWLGADYAAGVHGPSRRGQAVRLAANVPEASRLVARFDVVTSGSTLSFSIPRRALGDPAWFRFSVVAGREATERPAGGAPDVVPARGTLRYVLAG